MTSRRLVLEAHPWANLLSQQPPVATEVVEEAFDEVKRRGIADADDIRVVAFARYSGIGDEEPAQLVRQFGAVSALRLELLRHQFSFNGEPSNFVRFIEQSSTLDLVRSIGDPNAGWLFAVQEVALEADYVAIVGAVPFTEDLVRIISAEFVHYPISEEQRAPLILRFLQSSNSVDIASGRAIMLAWVRQNVLALKSIKDVIEIMPSLPKVRALATLGALIDDFFRWVTFSQLRPEQLESAREAEREISGAGKALLVSAEDVEPILAAAGDRKIHAIAAMANWAPSDNARQDIGKRLHEHAMEVFDGQFLSLMEKTQDEAIRSSSHPEWLIIPLATALISVGLNPSIFRQTYDRLAADEFSHATRFGTWLADRRRAIALIAIGAMVATQRSDQPLLAAVQEAVAHAQSQPKLDRAVVNEEWISQFSDLNLPAS